MPKDKQLTAISATLQIYADECRSIMEDERARDREVLSYRIERIERTFDAMFSRDGDYLYAKGVWEGRL